MSPAFLSALIIAIIACGFVILRPFAARTRFIFDLTGFMTIGVLFFTKHLSPAFTGDTTIDSNTLWLHGVAAVWWFLAARVSVSILWFVLQSNRRSRQARLFFDLAAATIYITAAVVVLNSVLALPIRGLLATSGLMAIVLGLALQNTLADVFSGIAVDIESPFSVGDRIQLGEKVEGKVVEINWRSIHVLTANDDVAIIPNSSVAKSDIINRSLPTTRRAGSVIISCPVQSTPERVVDVLIESTWLCAGILRSPAPSVTVSRIAPKRIFYTISFFVPDTELLESTKSLLLRYAQRQLYHAGLLKKPSETISTASTQSQLLSELTLFEHLKPNELDELSMQLQEKILASGDRLFVEGTKTAVLYIIAGGVVKITRKGPDQSAEPLGNVGAGDYLGEISLLTGDPYAVTATALTRCRVYALPHQAIGKLLGSNPEMTSSFEASVKRGQEMLHRGAAANLNMSVLDVRADLLRRIHQFFR
jgi:small-conductance mechanosensitive channel